MHMPLGDSCHPATDGPCLTSSHWRAHSLNTRRRTLCSARGSTWTLPATGSAWRRGPASASASARCAPEVQQPAPRLARARAARSVLQPALNRLRPLPPPPTSTCSRTAAAAAPPTRSSSAPPRCSPASLCVSCASCGASRCLLPMAPLPALLLRRSLLLSCPPAGAPRAARHHRSVGLRCRVQNVFGRAVRLPLWRPGGGGAGAAHPRALRAAARGASAGAAPLLLAASFPAVPPAPPLDLA